MHFKKSLKREKYHEQLLREGERPYYLTVWLEQFSFGSVFLYMLQKLTHLKSWLYGNASWMQKTGSIERKRLKWSLVSFPKGNPYALSSQHTPHRAPRQGQTVCPCLRNTVCPRSFRESLSRASDMPATCSWLGTQQWTEAKSLHSGGFR